MKWSEQQLPVFDWFREGVGHLVLIARAGTGKTTVCLEGIRHAPHNSKILLCAFSKVIAVELQDRLRSGDDAHPNAIAMTLHSLGFRAVRRFWPSVRLEQGRDRGKRGWGLAEKATGAEAPEAIIALVKKLHTQAREIAPLAISWRELREIALDFDCVPDPEWEDFGWDLTSVLRAGFKAMQLAKKKPQDGRIDFSDMIFLPVANNWLAPTYDIVVVDEAQDMNAAQLKMAKRVCRGRLCFVGDNRQAIFGFRGADSESLMRMRKELDASTLSLTRTYRCPKTVVEEARGLVPDFEAAETNADGSVTEIGSDDLTAALAPGDAVLSRLNAPLISGCLRALRAGVPARVQGRDVAKGLQALVNKLAKGSASRSIPAFLKRLSSWEAAEIRRVEASGSKSVEARVEGVVDKAAALREIAEGATGIHDLRGRITDLFAKIAEGTCVVFSSVHRAKGLEWTKVFVLADTLREGQGQEEDNIAYVAITRAQQSLVWVRNDVEPATAPIS